jgi:hypothetical protein
MLYVEVLDDMKFQKDTSDQASFATATLALRSLTNVALEPLSIFSLLCNGTDLLDKKRN